LRWPRSAPGPARELEIGDQLRIVEDGDDVDVGSVAREVEVDRFEDEPLAATASAWLILGSSRSDMPAVAAVAAR
jgi:hypothetical protein